MIELTQADVRQIVEAVVANLAVEASPAPVPQPPQAAPTVRQAASIYHFAGQAPVPPLRTAPALRGVYADAAEAVDRAWRAQKEYQSSFNLEDRKRIISSIRKTVLEHKETLARMAVEETGLGRYEDKVAKIELAASKTPGVEMLETHAVSGDTGLAIEEMAPYGLIGAVSPVTNPMETLVNNVIGILAAGNGVVYNVHPSSKGVCAYTVDLLNQAVTAAGGPGDLVTMVENPTMESMDVIAKSPKTRLMLGTGGPGLVKALLSSGKKAIGAAAGNPPVLVDETADLELAAREIIKGASFDNNLLCISEKEVFVAEQAAEGLIFEMMKQGAVLLTPQQAQAVTELALSRDGEGNWHTKKEWIGKDAGLFLEKLSIAGHSDARLIIFEAAADHPFVQLEQMMPVLPIVRVPDVKAGIAAAVEAEHGNRHTASMFSRNVDHLTAFARAVETTIFVKNAATLAGVGFGGEGYTTFTIAGATGEGLTCARTFTRFRRCVLAEGGFRII